MRRRVIVRGSSRRQRRRVRRQALMLALGATLVVVGIWALLRPDGPERLDNNAELRRGAQEPKRERADDKRAPATGDEEAKVAVELEPRAETRARDELPGSATLRVFVELPDVTDAQAKVYCGLFEKGGWPWEPTAYQVEPATEEGAACDFANLDAGSYAAAAFLDANGNLELDRNWLGMPKEPWALSGGVRPNVPVPPAFEDVSFDFDGTASLVNLTLRG